MKTCKKITERISEEGRKKDSEGSAAITARHCQLQTQCYFSYQRKFIQKRNKGKQDNMH